MVKHLVNGTSRSGTYPTGTVSVVKFREKILFFLLIPSCNLYWNVKVSQHREFDPSTALKWPALKSARRVTGTNIDLHLSYSDYISN